MAQQAPDAAGLFNSPARAAAGGADAKKRRVEPPALEERREKLLRADHVNFALLDHEGESVIDTVSGAENGSRPCGRGAA